MLATNKRDIHTCTCTLKYTQHSTRWMSVLWRNTSWANSLTQVKRKDAECFQTEKSRKVSLTLTPLEIHQKKRGVLYAALPQGVKWIYLNIFNKITLCKSTISSLHADGIFNCCWCKLYYTGKLNNAPFLEQ